jgi:hypothetical protein
MDEFITEQTETNTERACTVSEQGAEPPYTRQHAPAALFAGSTMLTSASVGFSIGPGSDILLVNVTIQAEMRIIGEPCDIQDTRIVLQ